MHTRIGSKKYLESWSYFLETFNILVQARFATSKVNLISSITNFVDELLHELPKDLGLKLEKSQIWV